MNTNILKKCLEELSKVRDDNVGVPNISYVRGMLETLIAMQDIPSLITHPSLHKDAMEIANSGIKMPMRVNGELNDEAAIMEARARAAVESIKAMSEASSHE